MKMNEELFYKLKPFNNHFNLRELDDKYLVKKADMSKARIRELMKAKIDGEVIPEDYVCIDNECYYQIRKLNGYDFRNVQVNDKAFSSLLDNGFSLLKKYHDNRVYLCDITERNIVYDGNVHFVDYDDICVNGNYPRNIYSDAFPYINRFINRKSSRDLVLNDKLCLLHVMLRIASGSYEDYLMDHKEYELDMVSKELKEELNDYIFGRREIQRENYLEEPIKELKKELRLS